MSLIRLETRIRAPRQRVFDLARCIDFHCESAGKTQERAVAGVTTGLIGLDQTVTWRAKHLGVWQHLTSRITACDPPRHFRDEMVRGAFAFIRHDHVFQEDGEDTLMVDEVPYFASPLGVLGKLVDRVFMIGYLRRFLERRNAALKEAAEGEAWRRYLQ